ncbi:DNA-binding transcriptional regulator, AcrR family [Halobacillus karajensis]|uniref:DNA-binding transcriptional repressor AcrR n=1 Tax=Halobacillus karajensis TaxID=195088 RepID=A0A024P8J4_9BACI|nr:TetR family transcriptional regulator [Halobacillus karajensis]CDQ20278.1 DNA-binding transcriptional repressor AcrR [Halobacillus karajensis]CDQ25061.1 DNA-binding transcriptional repressor AcrR [Halobacillus karajensis]CDQ28578.1 DNA-binding transcriptional repressor AcrR [Halobacillus karajensis]SEI11960.1 DNA-binding transcriptional regulator, AcrR family [Halobacillus karajensis]
MPKQTFFNLPENKQQSLLEATRIEFSRAPLHEASISNIIKMCGISRGSFYQYFEDKEDAFYYLLKNHSKQRQETFIAYLKESEGDIFEATTRLFGLILEEFEKEENRSFFKHVFLNMNHKIQSTFTNGETEDKFLRYLNTIKEYIDQKQLNTEDEEELYHAIHLVRMLMFNNIIRHFAKGLSKEQAMKNFTIELNLLKRGISI